ncbi:hypothetical protein GCM10028805_55560 [Spirosoma harenae]
MKNYLPLLLALIGTMVTAASAQQRIQETFDTQTIDQISTLKIEPTSPQEYLKLTQFAILNASDTTKANADRSLKAQVLLDNLATHLTAQIKNEALQADDETIQTLYTLYRKQGYSIIDIRPSEFEKIVHYIHEGKYGYIYNRLSNSWFFIPLVCSVLVVTLFSISNLIGLIQWRFRKHYNWLMVSSVSVVLVAFVFLMVKYK